MTGPDFIIIGGMKCGTSTFAAQLAEQDGIFMTTPKEPNFFSDDAIYARGAAWYDALFAGATRGTLRGEASTHYTKLPTHPDTVKRMAGMLNAPRLIYMIRNPLDRAISHYIHEWSQGVMGNDVRAAFDTHSELVDYGRYGMQISPFLDHFGAQNVMLTSLEQFKTAPQAELARVGVFIGTPGALRWYEDLGTQNASSERVRRLPLQSVLVDNPVARLLRRALVPKSFRTAIRQARQMKRRPDLTPDQRDRLGEVFLADREILAAQFPGHPALDLCYPFAR